MTTKGAYRRGTRKPWPGFRRSPRWYQRGSPRLLSHRHHRPSVPRRKAVSRGPRNPPRSEAFGHLPQLPQVPRPAGHNLPPSAAPEAAGPAFCWRRPRQGAYPSPKRPPGSQVWKRASRSYEELRDTVRGDFIAFDETLQSPTASSRISISPRCKETPRHARGRTALAALRSLYNSFLVCWGV
jgi:hypothetical protein